MALSLFKLLKRDIRIIKEELNMCHKSSHMKKEKKEEKKEEKKK